MVATKASELRSQSVMANKTLHDLDENLTAMKLNKAFRNDASFSEIEKEKQKNSQSLLVAANRKDANPVEIAELQKP